MLHFIDFLKDTPLVAFLLLLAVLATVVPVVTALIRARHGGADVSSKRADEPKGRAFMGTQLDLALLLTGLMLFVGLASWAYNHFHIY